MSARRAMTSAVLGIAGALLLFPSAGSAADPGARSCPQPTGLTAIRSVSEARRADCFGDRRIMFQAWGWDLMNRWPGLRVPAALGRDFVLSMRPKPPNGLAAFLPPSVVLPDPVGTPWENRDGIGPGDAWWRVTGHFDDPRATLCRPVEGDTIDDVPVVISPAEAIEFCRNHFVIDRLVWLPDGPPETATAPAEDSHLTGLSGAPGVALAIGAVAFLAALWRWPTRRPHPRR